MFGKKHTDHYENSGEHCTYENSVNSVDIEDEYVLPDGNIFKAATTDIDFPKYGAEGFDFIYVMYDIDDTDVIYVEDCKNFYNVIHN